jgi:hypothetical protein
MTVGGNPEVHGYRGIKREILQSPEPAESAGTTAYKGVPEEVGATLYGLRTWDKGKSPVY